MLVVELGMAAPARHRLLLTASFVAHAFMVREIGCRQRTAG